MIFFDYHTSKTKSTGLPPSQKKSTFGRNVPLFIARWKLQNNRIFLFTNIFCFSAHYAIIGNKLRCSMVYCTTPHGTMYDARWYNTICSMVQHLPYQSLSQYQPKSLANHAKVFRTPMFIPRSANICTMENHGLYHSRPTKVCTLSDKNHVVYDPKLPYLHP